MAIDERALATVIAKEEIRELVLLYSRGVDLIDTKLVRSLYTKDATDSHGPEFPKGTADEFCKALEEGMPFFRYTGHHVCNHMISVDGDKGEGEVYALAHHIYKAKEGGWVEDIRGVRYLDKYAVEDGRWRFSDRQVLFDFTTVRPIPTPEGTPPDRPNDFSYGYLKNRLFARGTRA
jgi:hypothetical protein